MELDSKNIAISRKQIAGEVPMVATEIIDGCLYTGLFGSLDSSRMQAIVDMLTALCEGKNSRIVIIDLGNVEVIDTAVATHLTKLAQVLKMIGVKTIFCGIKGLLARTMVTSGIALDDLNTVRDMKAALDLSYADLGYKLIKLD